MPLSASKHIALINAVLTTLLFSVVYIIIFLSFFTFKPLPLLIFIPLIFLSTVHLLVFSNLGILKDFLFCMFGSTKQYRITIL